MEYVSDEKVTSKIKTNPSLNELVHNQDVMKSVLRSISRNPTDHNGKQGYGHLKPNEIFSKKNKSLEELFNKDILDNKSKSFV